APPCDRNGPCASPMPTWPASVVSFTISSLTRLMVDVDVRTGAGNGADRKYVSSAVIFMVPAPTPRSWIEPDPLAKGAQELIDRGRRPEVEERGSLQGRELARAPLLRLLFCLARARRLLMVTDPILVIDVRILEVAKQLLEVRRVEHGDGQRRPFAAVFLVHELDHGVVIAVRRGGRVGPPRAEDLLAVAVEDAHLHAAGFGQTLEHRQLAAAIRRPVLGDHENLGGPAGLRHQPLDRGRLV